MTNKFAGIDYPVAFDCGKALSEVIGLAQKIFVDPNGLKTLRV